MKRINYLLFTIFCTMFLTTFVKAAPSYSLKVSSNSIENGSKVTATVTVSNTAAWNIKIISSGTTSGCSNSWANTTSNGANTTKSFSVTCKSTGVGIIAFTLSGDISGDGTTYLSGSKRVTVTEKVPDSTMNTLKSLSIDGYEISPTFDAEILEYSVTVPSTVNSLKINTIKSDSKSSVTGDGEVTLEEGANKVDINVTASNPIKETIDGKEYTIIKNSKNLTIPNSYIENKITINGVEVPCFINDVTNIKLIAMKDTSGNVYYFTYNEETNLFKKYLELTSTNLIIYPLNIENNPYKGWHLDSTDINNETISVLKNKNYQIFDEELYNSLSEDASFYLYMLCGAGGLIFICLILLIVLSNKKKKATNNVAKDEKNLDSALDLIDKQPIIINPKELEKAQKAEIKQAKKKAKEDKKSQKLDEE